jgi:hypothetical protein
VPQDDQTRDVFRANGNGEGLTFLGRCTGAGRAKFVMLYARTGPVPVEAPVELDLSQATPVAVPEEPSRRKPDQRPAADDLEGWWAVAQAERFAALAAMSPDFSFYGFARASVRRTYGVPAADLAGGSATGTRERHQQLYELTTGAAAVTESLQLERMLGQRRKEGPRDVDVAKVPGIDIAGHDWKTMMAGKTPDPEPLARLVPHDNYYLHFKRFSKQVELGDFLDQWGTTAARAFEVRSADNRLKERYEKQLCIRSSVLGRTFGPFVIKGLAVTGSDPYFREGTDVAVIFHVVNPDLFKAGVEPYLTEARKEFGDRLREGKDDYHGVTIESYVTPLREVSVYRAAFDEFVVYANSPVGLRRILDARANRVKPLADGLDFQYMRTVFKLSDENEDGFLFLSDPFIRNLVGPASKIKEKRRLEGLTGLTMATNAALWHAWQTGKPPADLQAGLTAAGLTPADLETLDQPAVTWDAVRQLAVGGRYNTIHFATPLVELPIDRVTREEAADYDQFRQQYLGLWRKFFDPVGMRFRVRDGDVGVETFILPLIQSTEYAELRRTAGGGTVPLDVSQPTATTVAQAFTHLAPDAPVRHMVMSQLTSLGVGKRIQWLGNWVVLRFDDSPAYAKLAAMNDRGTPAMNDEFIETVFQVPVTFGVQIRNPLVFAGVLTALRTAFQNALPRAVTWEPMEPDYKGVRIVRIRATPQGMDMVARGDQAKKDRFLPAVYYALTGGAWYVSLQEQPIKDMIDRTEARRRQPQDATAERRPVNSALYVSPAAAVAAKDYVRGYLEKEAHRRALANAPVWYAFERAGLLRGKDGEAARQAVLYHYLGYVPVSPDGAPYAYDSRADEVTNARHGSPRRPTPKPAVEPDSALGRLLETTRDVSADLRFREDGIHTAVTIRRQK